MNESWLLTSTLVFTQFYNYLSPFTYFKNLLNTESIKDLSITTTNKGWLSFDLEAYLSLPQVQKTIETFNQTENDWLGILYESQLLKQLHYRDKAVLLAVTHEFHKTPIEKQEDAIQTKRILTASAILYGFELPETLYCFDVYTAHLVHSALSATRLIDLDLALRHYDETKVKEEYAQYTQEELKYYHTLLSYLPLMFKYMGKIGTKYPPNIQHFITIVKKNHKELYQCVGDDLTNLCKLLTLAYGVTGLPIPRDYLYLDDWVYDYLVKGNYYSEKQVKRSHLTVVK